MIGGGGEKKTLRIVAEYADMWNVFGTPETVARKDEILRGHCADVGRDPDEIERTLGFKPTIRSTAAEAERVWLDILAEEPDPDVPDGGRRLGLGRDAGADRRDDGELPEVGFHTFIAELPAPYDAETMETLINVVRPMVEARRPADVAPDRSAGQDRASCTPARSRGADVPGQSREASRDPRPGGAARRPGRPRP